MSRAREREDDRSAVPGRRSAGPPAPAHAQLLRLQGSAGNAAVARAVLARDLPALVPQIRPQEIDPAIASKVAGYLETMRLAIQLRKQDGLISMPEVVNMVRQNVPEALAATPFQIELVVTDTLKGDTPPYTRAHETADGNAAQIEASILNSLPKPPTEFKLHMGPGSLAFSFSGVEAAFKAGPVSATADKDGAKVTVKEGDKSVTGSGSFSGDAFGLHAAIGGASFDASIHKDDATKQWSKFAANVKIPIAGNDTVEERPPIPEITEAVNKSYAAIGDVIKHLREGGSPDDAYVKEKLKVIKPGISGLTGAVEQRKGPKASLKLSVGAGDPKLGTYGTLSLVIEF